MRIGSRLEIINKIQMRIKLKRKIIIKNKMRK